MIFIGAGARGNAPAKVVTTIAILYSF